MAVDVDVWTWSGTACRAKDCRAAAAITLVRRPLPVEYYCVADGAEWVAHYRRHGQTVNVTPDAEELLAGVPR